MAKRIGEFLVERGVLTTAQVDQILEYSQKSGLRFGEAGISLGILERDTLVKVFGRNYSVDFFHVDSKFFPRDTKDALPADAILKFGALPLGSKSQFKMFKTRKILNVGLLDPGRREAVESIESTLKAKGYDGIKVFLILADQFLDVVNSIYGMSEEQILQTKPDQLDKTLALFLKS